MAKQIDHWLQVAAEAGKAGDTRTAEFYRQMALAAIRSGR